MESAKLIIEVAAGLIPNQPDPAFTKRWAVTGAEWEAAKEDGAAYLDGRAGALLKDRQAKADEYAATLRDPSAMNWVRVDWVWM